MIALLGSPLAKAAYDWQCVNDAHGEAQHSKDTRDDETRFSKNVVLIKHQLGFVVATSKGTDDGKLFKRRSRRECDPVS